MDYTCTNADMLIDLIRAIAWPVTMGLCTLVIARVFARDTSRTLAE